jgi:hypothetical protein
MPWSPNRDTELNRGLLEVPQGIKVSKIPFSSLVQRSRYSLEPHLRCRLAITGARLAMEVFQLNLALRLD